MKKRFVWALWGLVLAMLLAACGGESPGNGTATAVAPQPTETPQVGTAVPVETPPTWGVSVGLG
ncbi:MAG: hypothetical protein ACE5EY_17865, partial [Anaerolineae bacterium]